jgi:hypothetical protein
MSGIIGVNPAKTSGIMGAHDIRAGHVCGVRTASHSTLSGAAAYPLKSGGVTEIINMNTTLFTSDTANDYGITVNRSGRYTGFYQVYYTTPSHVGYSEASISVWNGSGYDAYVPDSYQIHYREHTGVNKWKTVSTSAIFDGVAGKTYGIFISVQTGTVVINSGPTRLILTYLGP